MLLRRSRRASSRRPLAPRGLAQGASATQATQAASPRARRKCLWPGKNNQACYVIARLYTDRPGDRLRAKQARRLAIVRAEAHGSALL